MKRLILLFVMIIAASTSYAIDDPTIAETLKNKLSEASVGTTYGIIDSSKDIIVINTPFGKYTAKKVGDDEYAFMGIKFKIQVNDDTYIIQSPFGTFELFNYKLIKKDEQVFR